jgi:hypothetical protein
VVGFGGCSSNSFRFRTAELFFQMPEGTDWRDDRDCAQGRKDGRGRQGVTGKDRKRASAHQVRLEKALADGALSEARVRVDRFNFGPPVGFPVQFRVVGPDAMEVRRIAYDVREIMRANKNAIDPHLDWNERMPAVRLDIDQDRARALGLTPQDIARTLQTLISGFGITTVRDGTEKAEVVAVRSFERLDLGGSATHDPVAQWQSCPLVPGRARGAGPRIDPLAAQPRYVHHCPGRCR